jgi:hypothetical protein
MSGSARQRTPPDRTVVWCGVRPSAQEVAVVFGCGVIEAI